MSPDPLNTLYILKKQYLQSRPRMPRHLKRTTHISLHLMPWIPLRLNHHPLPPSYLRPPNPTILRMQFRRIRTPRSLCPQRPRRGRKFARRLLRYRRYRRHRRRFPYNLIIWRYLTNACGSEFRFPYVRRVIPRPHFRDLRIWRLSVTAVAPRAIEEEEDE